MSFEVGLSGDLEGQEQKMNSFWTRRRVLTHAAVGRVEDAAFHDDDGTRRWKSHGWTDMATWDVSGAHLYGEARWWIYTYFLDGYEKKGKLTRLCWSMYGTRDAAAIWETRDQKC